MKRGIHCSTAFAMEEVLVRRLVFRRLVQSVKLTGTFPVGMGVDGTGKRDRVIMRSTIGTNDRESLVIAWTVAPSV